MELTSHPDPRTDAELIAAFNDGDCAAFDVLYTRYRDWVADVAHRFTGHTEDALDVLQETFIYLVRKRPKLYLSGRMTTFLYPVVKHLALAARRKRGRYLSDEDALAGLAAASNTDSSPQGDLLDVVRALPEMQREVLLLRFVDDLSLQEIADVLSVPLGTVKSRLHHAVAMLRGDRRTRRYHDV